MHFFPVRTFLQLAGAVSFAVLASHADAQVTLNLTTAQQTNCTAVTDAQGLHLVPGSTDLAATGVTLSGTGCGGGQSPATDFEATINVPSTATVGTPFTVNWSAAQSATQCTYGGSTGLAGWPTGTTACQGTACNGVHSAAVTVSTPGSYSLNVTCTNGSGYASGGGTAVGAPTAPVFTNPLAATPATVTLGQSFSGSWGVSGASSCQGTAELGGSSIALPGWTDVTSATSPRQVTPTQIGTYSLKLTCSNSVGSTTSGPVNVVVQGTNSCPAGRQTTADVCYNYNNTGANCARGTDVTTFSSLWGRNLPTGTPVAFPGLNYFTVINNMNASGYIAAQFTVPQNMLANQTGVFTHGETLPGPNVTMAISKNCGDFNPSTSICLRSDINAGSLLTKWKNVAVPDSLVVACPLTPGETYYVNFKMTRPTDCSGSSCTVTVQSNHTP